jgi:hypothetical protein
MGRRRSWCALGAALLSGAVLALSGCSSGGSGKPAGTAGAAATATITAQAQEVLRRRADVASAEVGFHDVFEDPGSATVTVTMKPGADPEAIATEAVRLVWLSRLDPLDTIGINVVDPVEPTRGITRFVNVLDPAVRGPLQQRYGPHPS